MFYQEAPFLILERWGFLLAMLQWFADILTFCIVSINGIRGLDLSDYMAWEMRCYTENISFYAD
ncbi:MAG: hypothetical protein JRJ86_02490 [Deltaproteobacteria bacterium]|nr:hypothetical protein [Deltaproteobacteria bacterium]MBW2117544.1 hypothetical protein [Deltaproteobacteria bacterium]MBW2345503.1 hypothetical protein [Deltaproteobacteria bacterium]